MGRKEEMGSESRPLLEGIDLGLFTGRNLRIVLGGNKARLSVLLLVGGTRVTLK